MNTKKTTAYFNNNQHKNNKKSWVAFRTLLEHLLQCDNEKNRDRFNLALSELSYIIYDNRKININELTEEDKLTIVQELINYFDKTVSDYENKNTDLKNNEEYKKYSHQASSYKSKLKKQLKDLQLNDTEIETVNNALDLAKIDEKIKSNSIFSNGQYSYSQKLLASVPTESVRKNIVLLIQAHNNKVEIENGKKAKVRSGQGFATDTVFRIPLQNNVNFEAEFLEKSTSEFYEKYLPDFKTKLICIHQNEYFMSEEEIKNYKINGKTDDEIHQIIIENSKKTAHCQTVIDLFNHTENKYNFTEKKIEAVNEYIKNNNLEYDLIPAKGTLNRKQSSVLGMVFQKMFYDYINEKQNKLKLVKVEELDKEDITEERALYIDRKARHRNIKLNAVNNFYKKDVSIKDSVYSAVSKMQEENEIYKKINTEILEPILREELTVKLTEDLTEELTPVIKEELTKEITQKEKPIMQKEVIEKLENELNEKIPAVRKKYFNKKLKELKSEAEKEAEAMKDKMLDEQKKKVIQEYLRNNQNIIIQDIRKSIEEEERIKFSNKEYREYYTVKSELITKLEIYPKIDLSYRSSFKADLDKLIDRLKNIFSKALKFFSEREREVENEFNDKLEKNVNFELNKEDNKNKTQIQTNKNTEVKLKF